MKRDVIKNSLKAGRLPGVHLTLIEHGSGLFPKNRVRPDSMTLVPWRSERNYVWDPTCSDTFAPFKLQ